MPPQPAAPAVQFNARSLQHINLPCALGGASAGWAWLSLTSGAPAQPASNVWPRRLVWGTIGEQEACLVGLSQFQAWIPVTSTLLLSSG